MFALCTKLVGTDVAGDLQRPNVARGSAEVGRWVTQTPDPGEEGCRGRDCPSKKVQGSVGALLAFSLFGYQDSCPNSSHRKG